MPGCKRMYLAIPYHIEQRGNNREVCFVEQENCPYCLQLLKECSQCYRIAVHAYCVITDHIYFLVMIFSGFI